MDSSKIRRVLNRISTEIIERNRNLKSLVIIGIKTRGIFTGKRIARLIKELEGVDIPVGVLDITRYRDDLPAGEIRTAGKTPKIDFAIDKKDVLLIDDVLMTGRTIRAAMDGLMDAGRPKTVQLIVLIRPVGGEAQAPGHQVHHLMRAKVRGQEDHAARKIHAPIVAERQRAFIEDAEQELPERVGGFLDFVKKD